MKKKYFTKSVTALLFAVLLLGCTEEGKIEKHSPHWDYENPIWQNVGYTDCGGTVQTPINIQTGSTIQSSQLSEVMFNYNPFNMKIVDNGHTVQVNTDNAITNNISIDGVTYNFLQFHYHTHSEHEIDGNTDQMEIHLVHQDPVTSNLAVIAIMLNATSATDNTFIQSYLQNFPSEEDIEVATSTSLNLNAILPANKNYYTYTGSLTTPPCSQGLKWIILKEKMAVSSSQLNAFQERHDINARPIQPLNGRIVLEKI
ncbi:carbonic anhydrase family protein [Flavobacterium sp. J49]|uniref:carbonic anhydrase n=1 Tax=Flavobacterium sp. J49 TaxID=2718534 RepID=UPI001594DC57|nr:carbonic anhydrase family protein [Flavobacterium sp. J49]MBF6641977.1 carbonic anhydrase family protein [Flavobacterium sp. J49]NIC03224.1 carbonic anhydrase family protein [Flavobacterium sp. J49]